MWLHSLCIIRPLWRSHLDNDESPPPPCALCTCPLVQPSQPGGGGGVAPCRICHYGFPHYRSSGILVKLMGIHMLRGAWGSQCCVCVCVGEGGGGGGEGGNNKQGKKSHQWWELVAVQACCGVFNPLSYSSPRHQQQLSLDIFHRNENSLNSIVKSNQSGGGEVRGTCYLLILIFCNHTMFTVCPSHSLADFIQSTCLWIPSVIENRAVVDRQVFQIRGQKGAAQWGQLHIQNQCPIPDSIRGTNKLFHINCLL